MKTSVIRQRVADFLKQNAPFDTLLEQDLLDLAGSGKVKFHESDEYVFRQGDANGQFVWVIQQGRVELVEESASGQRLRDVLGEGDLLGLDRFVGDGSCLYSARTASDVMLYGVAAAVFESAAERYPAVRRFLSAHASVSGNLGFNRTSWLEAEAPPLDFLRARMVSTREAPCSCPPAVSSPLSTRAAVRAMLQSRSEHLAISSGGGPVEAILTSSDLALFCGHDPARLIGAIRRAASAAEIAPLLRLAAGLARSGLAQPRDIDDCCLIGAEAVVALAEACIRLADGTVRAAGVGAARAPYCWVMSGGSARGDLLGPEFPTIAAVWDDSDGAFAAEDSVYFAALAGETETWFHALGLSGAGLDWPEGARPSMPLSEWKRLFSETVRNPIGHDLYARRSFFDFRLVLGDASVLQALQVHLLHELSCHETAIPLLANDTLEHVPPLAFFRDLVLDMDGAQRDSFDIAEAVIAPVANAARVFAIAKRRLTLAGTLARLETAMLDFPQGAAILQQGADAFRIGMYYRALAGTGGGSRIDPGKLGKFDKVLLKTAFSSVQRFLEFTLSTFVPTA